MFTTRVTLNTLLVPALNAGLHRTGILFWRQRLVLKLSFSEAFFFPLENPTPYHALPLEKPCLDSAFGCWVSYFATSFSLHPSCWFMGLPQASGRIGCGMQQLSFCTPVTAFYAILLMLCVGVLQSFSFFFLRHASFFSSLFCCNGAMLMCYQ